MGANPVADVTRQERKRATDTINETKGRPPPGMHPPLFLSSLFHPARMLSLSLSLSLSLFCLTAEIIKSWHTYRGYVKTHCADVSFPRKFQPSVIMNGYGSNVLESSDGPDSKGWNPLSLFLSPSLRAPSCSTDRRHLWFVAQITTNSWQVFAAFFLSPSLPPLPFSRCCFYYFFFFFFSSFDGSFLARRNVSVLSGAQQGRESHCFTTVGEASSLHRSVCYV